MILSQYTFLFKIKQQFYIYNTLSNALLELDEETYVQLQNEQKSKKNIDKNKYDAEIFEVLRQNRIIAETYEDEFLCYKSLILRQRAQEESMHLTIAPTMDCCFRCHYCFEKSKRDIYMSPQVMDSIVQYVLSKKTVKTLNITWFGGEPLMATTEIEKFYDKLKVQLGERNFNSNIITTGYHINKEVIRILKKVHVTSVQITLDGLKETHNKIKNFPHSGDVFEKVLGNIELLNDNAPSIQVVIRVNLTLENANEYVTLQTQLQKRFKERKNISITPAFVLDRNSSNCSKKCSTLFNHKQRSEFIIDLASQGIGSVFSNYPQRFFNECAIRSDLAISFDPEGYAYKCWESIGNKEYAIGKLDEDGNLTQINTQILNRQLYGADTLDDVTCKTCKYLPICHGGCPIQRIENKFEGGKNCTCIHYKGYMEQFLKLHLKLKEAGLKNK